jgi:ABC-type transport system substrate-binding protein
VKSIVDAAVMAIPTPQTIVETKIVVATPRPVSAEAMRITPTGEFRGAIAGFAPVVGWAPDCSSCSQLVGASSHEGLFTSVRTPDGALALEPWLVESWETASDLSFSDFNMREGVQFHHGWGEMTAEDVAWYFNLLNTVTNPESKHDTGVQIFDLA